MIKTLIIEDEPYIRKGLVNLINSLENDLSIIGECESVGEALTVVEACKPDLIFLDVNLHDGNAFDFLEQSRYRNYQIIFITAYEDYALRALKMGVVDYILKPVDVEELAIAIDKVTKTPSFSQNKQAPHSQRPNNGENERLILKLEDGYQVIDIKELKYCASDKGYTTFYLRNGKSFIASKTLKEFEQQLSTYGFIRTHQSYLVNINFIDKYDKTGYVVLKDGFHVPVSLRKREDFFEALFRRP